MTAPTPAPRAPEIAMWPTGPMSCLSLYRPALDQLFSQAPSAPFFSLKWMQPLGIIPGSICRRSKGTTSRTVSPWPEADYR